MKAAGCELLDYYVGMNNYKNYVIIECPVSIQIGPVQISMFSSGTITSAEATQILTSAELVDVAMSAKELRKAYGAPE